MKNNKRTQGFTLIELLIVIAIIGILAAVLIPNLLGAQKRAYDTGAASCAKSLQTAEATYQIDKQSFVTLSKAAGTTAVTVAATDANGAAVTTTSNDLGISSGCNQSQIVIGGAAAAGAAGAQSTYSLTVNDTRGSKTYTVTPSTLAGS